jgi:hypothetical protein
MTAGATSKRARVVACALLRPADVLQHMCSFMHDPNDLSNLHRVNKRYVCRDVTVKFGRGRLSILAPADPATLATDMEHAKNSF